MKRKCIARYIPVLDGIVDVESLWKRPFEFKGEFGAGLVRMNHLVPGSHVHDGALSSAELQAGDTVI